MSSINDNQDDGVDWQAEFRRVQADIDRARAKAGHQEDEGEVCRTDCSGCTDPVGALIAEVQFLRRQAYIDRLAMKDIHTCSKCDLCEVHHQ